MKEVKYKIIYNKETKQYEIYNVYGILIETYKTKILADVALATLQNQK